MSENHNLVDETNISHMEEKAVSSGNKPEQLKWLKDAGMGMFIHFSLDVQLGVVISHTLVGASEDYTRRYFDELPLTFNPKDFDADKIIRLAKICGFQYIVLTAKHHNGFCLWDTKTTDFNCVNTPFGRDMVGEYVTAVRKYGLKVGLYFSPEDFYFLYQNHMPITRNISEPYSGEFMERYNLYAGAQLEELLKNYGNIDVIFYDGKPHSPQPYCVRRSWELQEDIVVTRGAISTPEQHLPGIAVQSEEPWEACVTMGTAWQHQPTNERYKNANFLIRVLMEARAKGGTLLLNIGPDADGNIPVEQEGILRELGAWSFINREAFISVRPWIVTNEGSVWYVREKDEDTVYAVLFDIPNWRRGERKEILLPSVASTPGTQISVLGQSGLFTEYAPEKDVQSRFRQTDKGLEISVAQAQRIYCGGTPWPNPLVVRLTNVRPAYRPVIVACNSVEPIQTESAVEISADILQMGSFDEVKLAFEYREYPGFANALLGEPWKKTDAVTVNAPGTYPVTVKGLVNGKHYQCKPVVTCGNDSEYAFYGDEVRFVKA